MKNKGLTFFQMVPMLNKENCLGFFHDVAISSFVQYQFLITKSNFYVCTPRMNNSTLSKRTKIGQIKLLIFLSVHFHKCRSHSKLKAKN